MSNKDHSAFPSTYSSTDGLTKREYFAGLALQAIGSTFDPDKPSDRDMVAWTAVQLADALLIELEKTK